MTLQRGWNNKSKLLVVSSWSKILLVACMPVKQFDCYFYGSAACDMRPV